jgi:hypothetical protein
MNSLIRALAIRSAEGDQAMSPGALALTSTIASVPKSTSEPFF